MEIIYAPHRSYFEKNRKHNLHGIKIALLVIILCTDALVKRKLVLSTKQLTWLSLVAAMDKRDEMEEIVNLLNENLE